MSDTTLRPNTLRPAAAALRDATAALRDATDAYFRDASERADAGAKRATEDGRPVTAAMLAQRADALRALLAS